MTGLINKYIISKTDGFPVDPDAKYFVLRLDVNGDREHVIACRKAINTYLQAIRDYLPDLSNDLEVLYGTYRTLMSVQEINEDYIRVISAQIDSNTLISIDKKFIPKDILSTLKIDDMLIAQCNLGCEELDELFFYDFELVDREILERSKSIF